MAGPFGPRPFGVRPGRPIGPGRRAGRATRSARARAGRAARWTPSSLGELAERRLRASRGGAPRPRRTDSGMRRPGGRPPRACAMAAELAAGRGDAIRSRFADSALRSRFRSPRTARDDLPRLELEERGPGADPAQEGPDRLGALPGDDAAPATQPDAAGRPTRREPARRARPPRRAATTNSRWSRPWATRERARGRGTGRAARPPGSGRRARPRRRTGEASPAGRRARRRTMSRRSRGAESPSPRRPSQGRLDRAAAPVAGRASRLDRRELGAAAPRTGGRGRRRPPSLRGPGDPAAPACAGLALRRAGAAAAASSSGSWWCGVAGIDDVVEDEARPAWRPRAASEAGPARPASRPGPARRSRCWPARRRRAPGRCAASASTWSARS